ncbi:unnamed protein product [Ectocarpus sp. 8 AP-2014]
MSATPIGFCPTTGNKVDDLLDSGIGAQHDFSLTISARNSGNVDAHVFADVEKYLQERMVRGLVSLERGNVHGNLHVQGILTAPLVKHFDDPRKEEAAMRKSIRQACDWNSNVKVKIVIKRLMRQQTFSGMLGYCSKDRGGHTLRRPAKVSRRQRSTSPSRSIADSSVRASQRIEWNSEKKTSGAYCVDSVVLNTYEASPCHPSRW